MTANLPDGAKPIVDCRLRGKRPADMVLVSLGEPVQTANPIVIAQCGQRYDWRFVRGLDVCVYLTNDDEWPQIVKEIALCRPAHLELWNRVDAWGAHVYLVPTEDDISKPVSFWRYDLDFLPWMDFQNRDFAEMRRYARHENGMPYAIEQKEQKWN